MHTFSVRENRNCLFSEISKSFVSPQIIPILCFSLITFQKIGSFCIDTAQYYCVNSNSTIDNFVVYESPHVDMYDDMYGDMYEPILHLFSVYIVPYF